MLLLIRFTDEETESLRGPVNCLGSEDGQVMSREGCRLARRNSWLWEREEVGGFEENL